MGSKKTPILDTVDLYRNDRIDVDLALALPDGFKTYTGLAACVGWLRNTMPFKIYWVNEFGDVRVECPKYKSGE